MIPSLRLSLGRNLYPHSFYLGKSFGLTLAILLFFPGLGFSRQAGVDSRASQTTGTIEGTVTSTEDFGISDVIVTVEPLHRVDNTDRTGAFVFRDLPAGSYVLRMNIGELEASDITVDVAAGQTVTVNRVLQRDFQLTNSTTVSAASRAQERLLEAPAAVSVVDEGTIALEGGAGQLPSVLQSAAGAEYTQSGVYDIQFNSRGFNATLSRRVQVLLDGRDLAAPENKNQEWISQGFLTSELESIEFVRGPGAALYGPNSINGVVVLTSKSPRGTPGGRVRITTGDLGTFMSDVRWAGPLGRDWYSKFQVNRTSSDGFSENRTQTVEYPGLPLEVAPARDHVQATAFDARFDKYLEGGRQLVLETGFSRSEGGTYLSQGGRFSIIDSNRSWSRAQLNTSRWTAQAYVNTRYGDLDALYAPVHYPTQTVQFKGEVQGNRRFARTKGRVVFGGSYLQERASSADENGMQTLYQRAVTTKEGAAFGQLEYALAPKVKAVAALRWDESTLHTAQLSPKTALVYMPVRNHSFHVGFSRGFQVGNYNELFVSTPLAAPLDLSAIENAFAPLLGGVSLGFDSVPVLALGNPNLDVEKVKSVEVGYVGLLGSRARISVDVYRNSMRDFITDILPGVNPAYPPYQAPAVLSADLRAVIEQTVNPLLPGLTNGADGNPEIVYSLGNVGLVISKGVEAGGLFQLGRGWSVDGSYTHFSFELVRSQPGLEPKPNAPRSRAAAGVTYMSSRFSASFRHRWVDSFNWASGLLVGPVPSYNVSDVNASYTFTRHWEAGLNVSNVFNRHHYEMFGGDILRHRALVSLAFNW